MIAANPGKDIRFVGHSLGGGLASAASAVHREQATTFNAAGVNSNSVTPFGGSLAGLDQLVDAFRIQGEFLSTFQDSPSVVGLLMPDSNGTAYYLKGDGGLFTRHTGSVLFKSIGQL